MFTRYFSHLSTQQKLTLLLVLIVAAVCRLHGLDGESLFMDEIRQTSYYKNNPIFIVGNAAGQQQPPLDYWVGSLFSKVSNSDFSLRLPAAIFGILATLFLVQIISNISSFPLAVLFGLIFAVSPYAVYFSQDARPYSISISLFLLTLLVSMEFFQREVLSKKFLLFTTACFSLFLMTRALVPIVVLFSISVIVLVHYLHEVLIKKSDWNSNLFRYLLCSAVATFFFLPFFAVVLLTTNSQSYSPDSLNFGMDWLVSAFDSFDYLVLWPAYVAQMEPFIYYLLVPLLAGLVISIYESRKQDVTQNRVFLIVVAYLLPLCSFLHLLIYLSKTTHGFRPPYPIYLLPMVLILCAMFFWKLNQISEQHGLGKLVKLVSYSFLTGLVLLGAMSLYDSKTFRTKTDWRGAGQQLVNEYADSHTIIAASFKRHGQWRPIFYNYKRYPNASLDLAGSLSFPVDLVEYLTKSNRPPVLMIFNYREYYISPDSSVPIINLPDNLPDTSKVLEHISLVPELNVERFVGLTLVSLKEASGNTFADTRLLLDIIAGHNPYKSQVSNFYLMNYILLKRCQVDESEVYRVKAEKSVRAEDRDKLVSYFEEVSEQLDSLGAVGEECDMLAATVSKLPDL